MTGGAFRELKSAYINNERFIVVHYACGNFYESVDQFTPVACIAMAELGRAGDTKSFSVIDSASDVELKEKEKSVLKRFYDELRAVPDARVIHWNMNGTAFGFAAIAARYRYLFDAEPPSFPASDRKFDLDDIIKEQFGEKYADHPKLRKLCILNGLFMPHFILGRDEATAIAKGEYGPVINSTSEKVHLISVLFDLLLTGKLKTLNSVGWVEFAGEQIDAVQVVLQVAERTRRVWVELQKRYDGRDTLSLKDEYDAQDLMRSLLKIFFDDIREENPSPKRAGAASRLDFFLPKVELAVELKYSRASMTTKSLGEELVIDRERYAAHGKFSHLIFIVFDDLNVIRNPRGIESDLAREKSSDDFAVTVRILERR